MEHQEDTNKKEAAMKPMVKRCLTSVAFGGMDVHYKFSGLTLHDAAAGG